MAKLKVVRQFFPGDPLPNMSPNMSGYFCPLTQLLYTVWTLLFGDPLPIVVLTPHIYLLKGIGSDVLDE